MKGFETFPAFVEGLPPIDVPFASTRAWLIQGDRQQVVFATFDEETDVPEHAHEDQWEFVVSGSVRLRVDGREIEYGPGDNFFIPAGRPHSARVAAGYRALIVFDAPDRYQTK